MPDPTAGPRRARRRAVPVTGPWPVVAVLVAGAVALAVARPAAAAELVRTAEQGSGGGLTAWKAAILGIVEGLTEYLPISSTGHLLVVGRLLDLGTSEADIEAANTYAIAIQFGAIVAVAGLFWRRFRDMLLGLVGRSDDGRRLLVNLAVAFVPAGVIGFLFDDRIEEVLFAPWPIIAAWAVGGALILVLEARGLIPTRAEPEHDHDPVLDITLRQATIIGLIQVVAMWPGVSRSLATILAALLVGVGMAAAVEFSFLLGFVTLTAATGFKLVKDGGGLVEQFGVVNPLIGALFAFVSAVLAIKWMVGYLQRHSLAIFGWYRLAVAALAAALVLNGAI